MQQRPRIPESEFAMRVERVQEQMEEKGMDLCIVYGDEYRRENLRYLSNYWPIFERAALVIPVHGKPVLVGAPEGENVAREMSAWSDIRLIQDFTCVTVPDEIDYPLANFTSFREVFNELAGGKRITKVGIIGIDAMSVLNYRAIEESLEGACIADASHILFGLRLIKSQNEVECLKEAARIADSAYKALMDACVPGKTEREVVGVARQVAFAEGAEDVPFLVFGSGERTNTIVGRPTTKVIQEGDMIMAALAVQYEGYIATVEFPFVAGKSMDDSQRQLIDVLIRAADRALTKLGPGLPARDFVKAVRDCFREAGLDKYDVYSPLHGCGCAEAESPYPDENSELIFQPGMTVNTDISLFGHPAGGNRIEEGFVITDNGVEPMSPLVRRLSSEWLNA